MLSLNFREVTGKDRGARKFRSEQEQKRASPIAAGPAIGQVRPGQSAASEIPEKPSGGGVSVRRATRDRRIRDKAPIVGQARPQRPRVSGSYRSEAINRRREFSRLSRGCFEIPRRFGRPRRFIARRRNFSAARRSFKGRARIGALPDFHSARARLRLVPAKLFVLGLGAPPGSSCGKRARGEIASASPAACAPRKRGLRD